MTRHSVTTHAYLIDADAYTGRRGLCPSVLARAARPALLLAAAILATAFGAHEQLGAAIWVLALALFGMPHGAYDLQAIARTTGSRRRTLRVFAVYSGIMAACIAPLAFAPAWATAAFLLLSMHHFGVSDSTLTRGVPMPTPLGHAAGFGRGAVVIATVFAVQPSAAMAPFVATAEALGNSLPFDPASVTAAAMTLSITGALLVLAGISYLIARHRYADAGEELATVLAGAALAFTLPALAAIAAYFLIDHASGHCLRARTPGDPAQPPSLANAARVHRDSLLLLIPSIAMSIGAALLFDAPPLTALAYGFIAFCMTATLPHHLFWMDLLGKRAETAEH